MNAADSVQWTADRGQHRSALSSVRCPLWLWAAGFVALLAWNGIAARYANPLTLLHSYDGPQYQLLARNRLHGHREIADTAHTVGTEGAHPMWRPGLVWITEGLERCLGKREVQNRRRRLLEGPLLHVADDADDRAAPPVAILAPAEIDVLPDRIFPREELLRKSLIDDRYTR